MPLGSPKNAATEEGNRFSLIRILCVLLWAGAGIALMLLNGKPFFNALIAIGCLVISAIAVGLRFETVKSTWIVLHLAVIAMLLSMLPSQWSHQQRIERQIQATIERHRAAGQE